MVWLPYGEIFLKISLHVLIEYTNVTDRRMDTARRQAALMHSIMRQKRLTAYLSSDGLACNVAFRRLGRYRRQTFRIDRWV